MKATMPAPRHRVLLVPDGPEPTSPRSAHLVPLESPLDQMMAHLRRRIAAFRLPRRHRSGHIDIAQLVQRHEVLCDVELPQENL